MENGVLRAAECLYRFLSSAPPPPKKADLILALGSHDLRVADHAAGLYLSGAAPMIVCSGGYGKMTSGVFPQPEGVLFAARCRELGVPLSALLIEDRASNTGENFSLSMRMMSAGNIQTAVAVCKPYMAKRALAAGEKQWPGVRWSISVPEIAFEDYSPDEDSLKAEIELMVGDLQRLKVYAEKGFQMPVDIPEEAWAAYRELVGAGFDKYVIK
ncbi:MAG: YdcF family protein [Clostridiales bacterium]|nr:YdcF family protein [Clostridiales bacterium]